MSVAHRRRGGDVTPKAFANLKPRNYEAGSPEVDLELDNVQRHEFGLCRLTQNLTEKGVPGDEDTGIGFRKIQDGGL